MQSSSFWRANLTPLAVSVVVLGLWSVEAVTLIGGSLLAIDAVSGSETITSWLTRAYGFREEALAFWALLVPLVARSHSPDEPVEAQWSERFFRSQGHVGATLVIFGTGVLWLALDPRAGSQGGTLLVVAVVAAAGVGFAVSTFAGWQAIRSLPQPAVKRALRLMLLVAPFAFIAGAIPHFGLSILEGFVLRAVGAILPLIYENAYSDLPARIVGTTAFRVRIDSSCTGIEGMFLASALVIPYLWIARRELRFPRALWLVPVVVASVGIVNVGRIVLIVIVGQYRSEDAIEAFHSSIGWLLFAVTVAVVIPLAERTLGLVRTTSQSAHPVAAARGSAGPFLMPLIASLAVGAVISTIALQGTPWLLLRYAAALIAIVAAWRALPTLALRRPTMPILGGAAIAAFWIPSALGSGPAGTGIQSTMGGSSLLLATIHVVGFTIVTPLVEELAFRGFLLRRISSASFADVPFEKVSWVALAISSLAFGAMHPMWIQGSLAGVIFGLVARRHGIGGAFVAHAVANGLICLYALVTGRLEVVG